MQEASSAPIDGTSSVEPAPAPADRLPRSTKLVFGLGSINHMWGEWLYPGMVWPVFNIFLHMNPALVSTALMINRIFDAVTDPLFGWWSDNTRTRWGRRRPFILVGSVLAGLFLPVLFMMPTGWSESTYFWYMIGSSAIYITFVSCFNMPYQSLGKEMTPDYHERTSIYSHRMVVQKFPELAMFFASAFITLSWFNDAAGQPDILRGARTYGVILGTIMIIVGFTLFFRLRERYYHKVVEQKQERVRIVDTIWKALQCRPFRIQLSMVFAYGLGLSMVGTLGYYMTIYYVCGGDVATGSKWNFVMGIAGMIFGLSGVPVFASIAHRLGKRFTLMLIQVCAIAVFIGSWWFYTPGMPWLQIFATGLNAFTGAGFWMLDGSIGADVLDYDELETGKRREGTFEACRSWIMKLGFALGIGCSGFLLKATGFDASLGGDQTEHALTMMRLGFAAVPIVGLIVAMIALSRYPLTQGKMAEIRAQLEARRGKV